MGDMVSSDLVADLDGVAKNASPVGTGVRTVGTGVRAVGTGVRATAGGDAGGDAGDVVNATTAVAANVSDVCVSAVGMVRGQRSRCGQGSLR